MCSYECIVSDLYCCMISTGLGLNLFKLLMPDSIVPSVGYIPIINKKVSSVLNNVRAVTVLVQILRFVNFTTCVHNVQATKISP